MKKTARILMTAAKGGVGVGFVTVNTALALCRRGQKVLLLDASPFCRSHDTILGCDADVVYDIGDLAAGRVSPDKALLQPCPGTELYLLPGAFSPDSLPSPTGLDCLLHVLAEYGNFDSILVDAPALPSTQESARYFDTVCVVSDPSSAALRASEGVGNTLAAASVNTRLIINRFSLRHPRESRQEKAISMVDGAHIWLLGLIPPVGEWNETVPPAYPLLRPTRPYKKEPARVAFDNIAGRLVGEDIPLLAGIRHVRFYRRALLY